MDDLFYGNQCAATATLPAKYALPETLAEAERLAASIEQAVWRDTLGGVRDLRVEVAPDHVRLMGRCCTYYTKQRAQHAAMNVPGTSQLTNLIEVT